MPGTVVIAENVAVNKTAKVPALKTTFYSGETDNRQANKSTTLGRNKCFREL